MSEEVEYINMPSGGVPIPQHNDRAELIDKINPSTVVEATRHMLMGQEFDGSKWVFVPALKNHSLTELGAWQISSQLFGFANMAMSISRIPKEVIKARLKRIAFNTQVQLVGNFKEYGITNTSQFYFVHNIIFSIGIAVLHQAGDGSIQDLLSKVKSESTTISQDRKEPNKLKRILGM